MAVPTNIPIEMFSLFIVMSISFAVFGFIRNPQIPVMVVIAGMFILAMTAITTNIDMGNLVKTSVTSGSTTTYTYQEALEPFTNWHKVLFAIMGASMILVGALMVVKQ